MHLDALVQWRRQIQAAIAHRRRGRRKCARAGGGRIRAEGDGRSRHQRPLLRRRAVSAIRSPSRGDLFAGRIAVAFSAAGGADPAEIAPSDLFTRLVNNFLPPERALFITNAFMVGKVVIGTLVCALISVGTSYAQQVEVPREKAGKIAQHPKLATAQPMVEVRPQTVAVSETLNLPTPKLSIEQMRRAHRLAGHEMKEVNHDIETDSSRSQFPTPPPTK